MATQAASCPYCQSVGLVRNGRAEDGRQRFLCRDCGKRSRQEPRSNAYSDEERELILRAYQERVSLRGLTRTFGVARDTVAQWVKKRPAPSRR